MNRKGQVMQNLGALGVGVAALAIVLVVTFLIMAQANTNMENDGSICDNSSLVYNESQDLCTESDDPAVVGGLSNAYNATRTLTTATATIPNWVSIIIITAIGSILIGMVSMFRR